MKRLGFLGVAVVAALVGSAAGRGPSPSEFRAVAESLSRVPPKYRAEWLQQRGWDDSRYTTYREPESTGLRLVGKYGRGPSVAVTGRDTLVALTLGSEVALLSVAAPDQPRVLSGIQVNFLPGMSVLHDSFVLIGGNGIEVWNIADPTQPVFRHVIPCAVSGFAVFDTFLYFVSRDTFHAYSIGRPASPYRIGFCLVSGNVGAATQSTAVLRLPGDQLGFIDVSDPAAPHLAGTYPGFALAFAARNSICCAAFYWSTDDDHFRFEVLDITDPTNVTRLAALDSVGGWDVHLSGPFVFVSGFQTSEWEFTIVDVQDSAHPHVVSSCATPGSNYGVWADWTSDWAYLADDAWGMAVLDISNLNAPVLDTSALRADLAQDVFVDGVYAYVAVWRAGMKILDVSDVTNPHEVGAVDTSRSTSTYSAVARDSFAFTGWSARPPYLRTVNVSDPTRPVMAGGCQTFEWPKDMVLRDSLVYAAMPYRFQVVNVARPRQPELTGTCNTQDGVSFGLAVQDSLAYIISGQLQVVNVARPDAPFVVGTARGGASGIAVRDTFAYIPYAYDTLWVYSIADPSHPRLVFSTPTSVWPRDVALGENTLYVGTSDGWGVDVYDLTDPGRPTRVGRSSAPYDIRRLHYADDHLYAAMWDAGVGIYAVESVGVSEGDRLAVEQPTGLSVRPNPAHEACVLAAGNRSIEQVTVRDVAGRVVMEQSMVPARERRQLRLDLSRIRLGVYFIEVDTGSRVTGMKLVKH